MTIDELQKLTAYTPTNYVDNSEPDINAEHLNNTEQALKDAIDKANEVIDTLKSLIATTIQDSTDTVPASSLLYELNNDMQNRYSLLVPETLIPNNADLNDYTTPGHYYTPNAAASQTIQNTPYTGSGFKLIVEKLSNNGHTLQTLKGVNSKFIYYRTITDSKIGDWLTPVTNADLARGYQSVSDIGANSYKDTTVNHGLSGNPTSAIATLRINSSHPDTMKNIQIEVSGKTNSTITFRIHNANSNSVNADFSWIAML